MSLPPASVSACCLLDTYIYSTDTYRPYRPYRSKYRLRTDTYREPADTPVNFNLTDISANIRIGSRKFRLYLVMKIYCIFFMAGLMIIIFVLAGYIMDGASIDPGPTDGSLLVLQKQQCSRAVWEGYGDSKVENASLICRRNDNNLRQLGRPSPRIVELIYQAGFGGILEMPFITLDRAFITALIERWRPETHTFHLRSGESTVTLQDVEIITGLAVNCRPVTGDSRFDKDKKKELCERLLGLDPPGEVMSGFKVSLKWLRDNFNGKVEEGDDEVTVLRKAWGYILQLIGGIVLPDQSSSHVHLYFLSLLDDLQLAGTYSWGSACLATLYHYLDFSSTVGSKDLGGMFVLLQVWGWERFPFLAPARNGKRVIRRDSPLSGRWDDEFHSPNLPTHVVGHYRFSLDVQRPDEVVWQPYTEDLIQSLPRFCSAERGVWMASVPLIQFSHVEQHQPERVLRQFGGRQATPPPPPPPPLLSL
ncbi:serine/threonine-protein phosphatase 7 long form homolog [Rhododendron vialii]|uniref:serine/threonine-protein phosphatase 7 long form homolog n=1 Tax=Rhododendron vialii TaxID=182163 RepID=UPI0026601928|nr:serine/threonine-protein phosphatase 7 long form homolog [Rhododendron vialii]